MKKPATAVPGSAFFDSALAERISDEHGPADAILGAK